MVADAGETVRKELRDLSDKLSSMRREHMFKMDEQKEKFMELLHKHNDLQRQHEGLQMALEVKEQECSTL